MNVHVYTGQKEPKKFKFQLADGVLAIVKDETTKKYRTIFYVGGEH
jgi:hypothetical protein